MSAASFTRAPCRSPTDVAPKFHPALSSFWRVIEALPISRPSGAGKFRGQVSFGRGYRRTIHERDRRLVADQAVWANLVVVTTPSLHFRPRHRRGGHRLTLLVTERGQPFVKESFGNWFRKAGREAGCPGSAHGLWKARATRAAENVATERELMALFGWSTGKVAQHYTRAADARRLPCTPLRSSSEDRSRTKNAPTFVLVRARSQKERKFR